MSSKRFVPGNFQYNIQVAGALAPCLAVTAAIGGKPVMATMAIGAMISYMMDTLQFREGAFTCSWLTLVATHLAFVSSLVFTSEAAVLMVIGLTFSMAAVVTLTGIWVSLQFKWIQMQYPAVAIVFERILVTGAMPIAAIMHSLALALVVEAADIPYFLAASLCGLYYSLGRPLASSFSNAKAAQVAIGGGRSGLGNKSRPTGPGASSAVIASAIQSRVDGFILALITVALPPLMYAALHWTLLLQHLVHIYSLLLLGSVPLLFVALIPNGLWWLPGSPAVANFLRSVLLTVSGLSAMIGFEGRVVFHAFRQYIKLQPPWDWLAVTAALLGLGAAALAHHGGIVGRTLDVTVAGVLMLLCTTAGSLAAGVPFAWLPAPLVAAVGLALYYDSGSAREYSVFVLGAAATGVWFVRQHFWFLDIIIGFTHLHTLCKLLLIALVPALLVPGLVVAQAPRHLIGALLMLQASLLCVLEERLYAPSNSDSASQVMYPAYCVLATSVAGLTAARRLMADGLLSPVGSWVLHSLYIAKISMLVLPEAYLVLPAVLLAMAALSPMFLYEPEVPQIGVTIRRRIRLAPWQGLLHIISVLGAVALARFAVFDLVQFVLSSRPSEGILLGALLLTFAAALVPLQQRCYSGNQVATRLLALLAMAGTLLIFLQPPMPLRGGARCPQLPLSLCPRLWDERHVPIHGTEDVEVWGRGLSRRDQWPRWMLVAACMLGASAATLGGAAMRSIVSRLGLATASGLLVGSYLALEVVPEQPVLQVSLVIACLVVVAFVVLLQLSAASVPGLMPMTFSVWLVVLGLTMLLQTELPTPETAPEMRRLFPDSKTEVDREVWMATRASLLGVFATHALLMAFTLKIRASSALRKQEGRLAQEGYDQMLYDSGKQYAVAAADLFCSIMPSQVFARFSGLLQMRSCSSATLQRLGREGLAWAPCVSNICTGIAFLMALSLNVYVTGGSPEAIFMLAPLLLLLSQDPLLLPWLEDRLRYFPPALATTLFLTTTAISQAIDDASIDLDASPFVSISMAVVLVACALPSHIMFLRWLWIQKPMPGVAVLSCAPLNLIPLILAVGNVPRYLALLGLAVAFTQYFAMKHVRGIGIKII